MRLHIICNFLLCAILALATAAAAGQTKRPIPQKPPRPTGTFSNMYYNTEGGDLIGVEIKIAHTRKGYQGVVQFAEGEPEELVIVNIEMVGTNISFSVPASSPYAGQFNGIIESGTLKGEFHFKTGGVEKVELKRGRSYWD